MLAFIHIPRTGGSTFRRILGQNYTSIYDVDPYNIHESVKGYDGERVLWGHVGFNAVPGAKHIVILRDPVERVASEYRYIRERDQHHCHDLVRNMTLEEYALSGITTAVDNQMVRLMCGNDVSMAPGDFPLVPEGCVSKGMLREAKDNLLLCTVGIFEDFDNFVRSIAERYSWTAGMWHENGTEYVEITGHERAVIKARNWMDCELYEHALDCYYSRRARA